eukprot:15430272-Alexandrium_andersonii.AAC.1
MDMRQGCPRNLRRVPLALRPAAACAAMCIARGAPRAAWWTSTKAVPRNARRDELALRLATAQSLR